MARTLKRSIIQNTRQYEEQKHRRRNRRGRNIVLLLLFFGMFVLGFNRVIAYEDNISRRTFTVEGNLPVPVLEMYPATGETSLVAVVAHGFSGSKELMASFGVELARAGVTAYLFDFPGHGESPVPLAFASIVIVPGLSFLGIVLPVLVLVFLMMVAFCTQLYTSGRAAIAAATFSALVMAWCMSTTFPITA